MEPDEDFYDGLREPARPLRYEPSSEALTRVAARIRQEIALVASTPSVWSCLANWLRPIMVALLLTISLSALVAVISMETSSEAAVMSSVETELLSEDYYLVAN